MKKLLQINVVVNAGSTGRIAEDIGNLMISKGWSSYIAFGRFGNESGSELIKIGNKFDKYFHALITRIFDRHGFASKNATKKLIKKIEKINPDIIHLHNIHGYYLNVQVLFGYLAQRNKPVVWTLHDCWSFTGHCVHFESIGCTKWKNICEKCPISNTYPESHFLDNSTKNFIDKKRLFNSLDNLTLIPVSFWLRDLVQKSFLKNNNNKTIHNGIDLSIFKHRNSKLIKEKLKVEEKFIMLGVASFWGAGKGLLDFIRLSDKISDDEVVILVGLTKNQIKELPKNIIGIEKTDSPEELAQFYSMSNVFLNLTYADTFPTTNLESLACGTPVITYKTGGSPEAVSDHTGFIIPQANQEELLSKISVIKKKGNDYYKDACITRAFKNYNKNDRYEDYFKTYENLIKKKPSTNVQK